MERAQPLVVDPGSLERHVLADDLHDVRAVADLGDLVLRDQPQISYSKFLGFWREATDPKGETPPSQGKSACLPAEHAILWAADSGESNPEALFWNKISRSRDRRPVGGPEFFSVPAFSAVKNLPQLESGRIVGA